MIGLWVGLLLQASADGGLALTKPGQVSEQEKQRAILEYKLAHPSPEPDARPKIPPFKWKLSNIIQEMPIDGVQVANDVPVKLHSVLVKGRREDVMLEILDHFNASGLYVQDPLKQAQPARQLQITGLDRDRALSYTAMVDGLADGTCLVVLGEANIGVASYIGNQRKKTGETVKDFVALMPNAIAPFRSDVELMHSVGFTVASDEASVRKFYRDQLTPQGYVAVDGDLFRKGTEEIALTMKREAGRLDVLLTKRPATVDAPTSRPPSSSVR